MLSRCRQLSWDALYCLPSLGTLACMASCSVFLPEIGVLVIAVFFILGWRFFGSSVERSQKNSRGDLGESQYSGELRWLSRLPERICWARFGNNACVALGSLLRFPIRAFLS